MQVKKINYQGFQGVEGGLCAKQQHIAVDGGACVHIASSVERCACGLSLSRCLDYPEPLHPSTYSNQTPWLSGSLLTFEDLISWVMQRNVCYSWNMQRCTSVIQIWRCKHHKPARPRQACSCRHRVACTVRVQRDCVPIYDLAKCWWEIQLAKGLCLGGRLGRTSALKSLATAWHWEMKI